MSGATIFLVTDGTLTPLSETPYAQEAILQKALEDFPDVLAGPATAGQGARLLLVAREMRVPDSTGSTPLSLDHLFVDSDGVPVLVEVKRATDTRIRREVVAQMLDYAANGAKYWPVEQMRALVEQNDPTVTRLTEVFGDDVDADRYWRTVEQNLRAGRIRLIFLADQLPPELVRVIEFLNEQMQDTEVLGVEVPQYTAPSGEIVYVPRVIGRTTAAIETKRGTASTRWTEESTIALAEERNSPEQAAVVRALCQHVRDHDGDFSWGTGASPGVTGWYKVGGQSTPVWNASLATEPSRAVFYFILAEYASRHPERIDRYARAIAALPGLAGRVEAARMTNWKKGGWMRIPLSDATTAAPHAGLVWAAIDEAVTGGGELT